MGAEKAALRIGGETLLARIVRRLRLALPDVFVVGPPHLRALAPGVSVFPDETPRMGPLGGLSTALAHMGGQHIFIVGCDMPFVEPALVRAMARFAAGNADADVVALRTAQGLEPLHAVYARSCAPAVAELLKAGEARSLGALLARLRVKELPASEVARCDPAGISLFNANAPADWQEALAIYAQVASAIASE
jgi:molybdopterin-guanine dinucleotide biosynthesis protein A